jgi:hypothetical protein
LEKKWAPWRVGALRYLPLTGLNGYISLYATQDVNIEVIYIV